MRNAALVRELDLWPPPPPPPHVAWIIQSSVISSRSMTWQCIGGVLNQALCKRREEAPCSCPVHLHAGELHLSPSPGLWLKHRLIDRGVCPPPHVSVCVCVCVSVCVSLCECVSVYVAVSVCESPAPRLSKHTQSTCCQTNISER